MAKMHVENSVLIDSQKDKVLATLKDMSRWQEWSPWMILEPEAKVKVAADARSYSWEGDRIGSGEMKILKEDAGQSIDYDLIFLKPWKSKAKVRLELKEREGKTHVNWIMDSSLPFFLFWMKKMMQGLIRADFGRGLLLLKDLMEDGEVHSKLSFEGFQEFDGCDYVAIKRATTMENVGMDMSNDFEKLNKWAEDHKENVAGEPFSIYHKYDFANGNVVYTSGWPVKEIPESVPEGFVIGKIPKTKVNVVAHTGSYRHLGNPWSAQYSMHRSKAFKVRKGIHPFETYQNMPGEVPENELKTKILFPCK